MRIDFCRFSTLVASEMWSSRGFQSLSVALLLAIGCKFAFAGFSPGDPECDSDPINEFYFGLSCGGFPRPLCCDCIRIPPNTLDDVDPILLTKYSRAVQRVLWRILLFLWWQAVF